MRHAVEPPRCAAEPADDELLDLPELDGDDEREGLDDPAAVDGALVLPASAAGAADDELPGDVLPELPAPHDRSATSVLGDDAAGLATEQDDPAVLAAGLATSTGSLLDAEPSSLGAGDDESLGIEPPRDGPDRSDAEGLDDPNGDRLDAAELPALDAGDDGEVDVGIDIEPLPEPAPEDRAPEGHRPKA